MYAGDAIPSEYDDVVVLRWPEQRGDAERLERFERPYLLLVRAGSPPPELTGCMGDWIRMPADDDDIRARLVSLRLRARRHPSLPELGEHGEMRYHNGRAFLSPTDERIARLLVENFERGVAERQLYAQVFDNEGGSSKIRVHISRLRKRLEPLGLEIVSLRGYGYRLQAASVRAVTATD